nr:immunoglobulin light chain junction region [Macaca mulatta]MOV97587.1 immunoglobulin light chain junction region [Macaca mulatta]
DYYCQVFDGSAYIF